MKTTTLGSATPIEVSRLGLGLMGISAFYTGAGQDDADGARTILGALDRGVTFLDTAEMYGPYTNEELVGKAIKGKRDKVQVLTKCGMRWDDPRGSDPWKTQNNQGEPVTATRKGDLANDPKCANFVMEYSAGLSTKKMSNNTNVDYCWRR